MTATALLDALRTKGVHLTVEGERLTVDAPKNVLSDDLRQAIRQYKGALLALLSQSMAAGDVVQPPAPTFPEPLTQYYPCVVCGKTARWEDHGVWRCLACWPPGSLAQKRRNA